MKLTKEKLKEILRESIAETEGGIDTAVAGLGGSAKTTVKNQAVQKFIEQVGTRLSKVGRGPQIEFLTGLMQTLGIDPSMLTQVKTAVQKGQRAAAAAPQGEPQ
jgi:CO dehydrogenase nickel-insertion accessory protein CooC1